MVFASLASFACSCNRLSFEKANEWADEIFIGRVIKIREVKKMIDINALPSTRIWSALFEVEKKWKGSSSKYVEVFQGNTSCDFHFKCPSKRYIVYAKKEDVFQWDSEQEFIKLTTWLCARNASEITFEYAENGFDDREKLNHKYPNPVRLSSLLSYWKEIFIGGLILLLGILIGKLSFRLSKR